MIAKPKICFITPSFGVGGAERWILTLTKFFKRVCVDSIVILSGTADNMMIDEAQKMTNVFNKNFYEDVDSLKKILEKSNCIISWAYNANLNLANELKIPSIDVSHSDPAWLNQQKMIEHTSKKSKYHVGVSKTAASSFDKKLNAKTIYNGIDTNRLFSNISSEDQKKEWGCENKKIVLFSSRISPEKNPQMFFDVADLFDDSWMFLFVGIGSLYEKFKSMNKNNVKIVSKTSNIGNYYNASDVVVLTSKIEGMPLVLMESWYCGVPTVTTEYSTYKELKEIHGNLSWSVPVDTSLSLLALKIKEAYYAGKKSERVLKAKNIIENYYTAEIMAKNWEDYIFNILNNRV